MKSSVFKDNKCLSFLWIVHKIFWADSRKAYATQIQLLFFFQSVLKQRKHFRNAWFAGQAPMPWSISATSSLASYCVNEFLGKLKNVHTKLQITSLSNSFDVLIDIWKCVILFILHSRCPSAVNPYHSIGQTRSFPLESRFIKWISSLQHRLVNRICMFLFVLVILFYYSFFFSLKYRYTWATWMTSSNPNSSKLELRITNGRELLLECENAKGPCNVKRFKMIFFTSWLH